MPAKSASIIIPAFNAAKTIAHVLEAVLRQDCEQKLEVIAVDDGSTDKTGEIIKSFPRVKYLYQKNKGPAEARNRGFEESTGEIVFFIDSDCVAQTDWVKKSIEHFDNPKIAVVSGSYDIANPQFILAQCIHDEIVFRHQRRMPNYPKSFGSYNFCVRRNVFKDVGGFNASYRWASGEDNDLSYKILKKGFKIYFEKDSKVRHFHTTRLTKYLLEQFRHGLWRVKIYLDHPVMAKGDDYTFWKDLVEPPLVLSYLAATAVLLCSAEFFSQTVAFCYAGFATLIVVEIFYGYIMAKNKTLALFWGSVMFLRAFARTLGFMCGLTLFFPPFFAQKISKKVK